MSETQKNVNDTDTSNFIMSTSSASNISHSNNSGQPQKKRQKIEKNKSFRNNAGKNITKNARVCDLPNIPDDGDDDGDDDGADKRPLCSSVSSSVSSISTNDQSSSSSPITTPSNSRAASLSQLINAQNITNTTLITATGCNHEINVSSDEHSADEVDRIPTGGLGFTPKSQQNQQPLLNNNVGSAESSVTDMEEFEESLKRECLCGVSEHTLRKPFQSHYSHDASGAKRIANLCEWPTNKLLQFLSNLQLLFDIYLKQNSKGYICARIMDVCDALIRNDHNLIDEIIVLAGYNNAFVQFLAGRVLASFLVIAKHDMNDDWLKKLVGYLFNFEHLNHVAVQKIHFSLEIIKRIVEWKDVGLHPLEDEIESETEIQTKINVSPIATEVQAGTSESTLEAHRAYVHFPMRQPTLETNYFAVHFDRQDGNHQNDNGVGGNGTFDIGSNENYTSNISSNSLHFFDSVIEGSQSVQSTTSYHNSNDANAMHNFLIDTDLHNFQQAHYQNVHLPPNGLQYNPSTSGGCHLITLTDSESYDTTHLKCITIKILENKWPALVKNMSALIANHLNIENTENCILNFLQLWENIISVKANLSIVETLPFYAQLDKFELLLNQNLSCAIYKQMLCLFNEALCYGSTLALQDMLPDETCMLAHQIVRHVKDFSILESLPRRQPENIVSLIGFKRRPVVYTEIGSFDCSVQQDWSTQLIGGDAIEMDKTILQKMVLLVLKSIAVTVKEIRSDSSDSSIDSTDYDAFQDMVLIERSIRDVLQKLESFIKNTLEFHPECHFSKILIHLFDDQDDHLIEAMVCTLDVTSGISFRNNAFPELVAMLNPVYTFLEFLKMISNSSDLLLDLLVSNETCFLLYLLRFLKYIRANWSMLERSCLDFGVGNNTLDEAMSVLIRLRLQISRLVSRQLYPYDISPVLRLLESCESLYEGNELS